MLVFHSIAYMFRWIIITNRTQNAELTEQSRHQPRHQFGHQSIPGLHLLIHEEESGAVGFESSAQLDESELRVHLFQTVATLPLPRHQSLYPAGLGVLFRQNVGEDLNYELWLVFLLIEISTHYLNKKK